MAEGAAAAGPVYPRYADSGPDFETFNLGAQLFHGADYLVTGDQGRFSGWELTFDNVEVGAADATGRDPDEYLTGAGLRGQGTPSIGDGLRSTDAGALKDMAFIGDARP